MDAISLRGYWRTFRPPKPPSFGNRIGNIALDPAIRITKLTTIASTGRLMKRSVNDFIYKYVFRIFRLSIGRFRIQFRFWRKIIVHCHSHSVAQFENSGADHGLAGFQSLRDRDKIATRIADPHKLLAKHL